MSQEEFAEHIEDGVSEIVKPSAASMLNWHRPSRLRRASTSSPRPYSSLVNVSSPTTKRSGHLLAVPGRSPFPRSSNWRSSFSRAARRPRILARFRFRIGGGQLRLGYKLDRPEEVLRGPARSAADEIREADRHRRTERHAAGWRRNPSAGPRVAKATTTTPP